jgi:hypothetical protein
MATLVTLNVQTTFGQFEIGETVTSGIVFSTVKAVNPTDKTISVDPPLIGEFKVNTPIVGANSLTVGTIVNASESSALDLVTLFGNLLPDDFSFTDYILNIDTPDIDSILLSTADAEGTTGDSKSATVDEATDITISNPSVAVDPSLTETRQNPLDPTAKPGSARPSDRYVTPVANEPVDEFKGEYPYNKVYVSEGGHLIEIDDTPDHQRLLEQHVSGTYREMKPNGNYVHKVVNDNYTIVCGDDFISVEGAAQIVVKGNCQLRVGGFLTVAADAGINVSTKGDFRVKARSINMESTGGNISMKSAKDTLITSKEDFDIKSKANHIDSTLMTSMTVGEQFIIEAKKISQHSTTDIALVSDAKTSIQSTAETNIKSGAAVNVEGAGNINLKAPLVASSRIDTPIIDVTTANITTLNAGTTNLRATGTDTGINGGSTHDLPISGPTSASVTAAAAAAAATLDAPVAAEASKGSGISFLTNVEDFGMATDDDPDGAAAAIKHAIDNGIVTKEEIDAPPEGGGESDDTPPTDGSGETSDDPNSGSTGGAAGGARAIVMKTPTIKNVGTRPPDNLRLSTRIQLSFVSTHAAATPCAVSGPNSEKIVQNLQLLAQNCLEKIKVRFPDMKVTSGYRNFVPKGGATKSQHLQGQAADMQFNCSRRQYYEIAKWIKDNVPYDQLLLEYKNTGTKNPWIHISFKASGNRNQVMTFFNHRKNNDGLKNLNPNG